MGETKSLNWRVLAAVLFSGALVAGTYALASDAESPALAQASAETALLQALATRDSTGDGLPDWQKALYGIPLNAGTTDYFHLGMTDGEAVARGLIVPRAVADIAIATSSGTTVSVDPSLPPASPGSLTDAFAKNFFSLYLTAKQANGGGVLSQSQVDDLAANALNSLSSLVTAAPDYKSLQDLTVAGSGRDALKAFAASAEAVITKNKGESHTTGNELTYLQDLAEKNDASAIEHLVSIAKMYRDSAVGLAALPVPSELALAELTFINGMMREAGIVSDFARMNSDPLAAMLALDQYEAVNQSAADALAAMGETYATAGVTLPEGVPGADFLSALAQYKATAASQTP